MSGLPTQQNHIKDTYITPNKYREFSYKTTKPPTTDPFQTLTRHRPRPRSQQSQWSRSYPPETPTLQAPPEEQTFFERPSLPASPEGGDTIDRGAETAIQPAYRDSRDRERYARPPSGGWRREHEDVVLRHGENRPSIGRSRILSNTLDHVLDNSDRRQYGMGWVGKMFG